jgi:ApaG protein
LIYNPVSIYCVKLSALLRNPERVLGLRPSKLPAMNHDPKYHIDVEVQTRYLEEQSAVQRQRYAFAYTVTLHNLGTVAARLVSRHWIITDANGHVQEVRGAGVVGEQPTLAPGEGFRYTSGTLLGTPNGAMRGSYRMEAEDGTHFDAAIPEFTLTVPRTLH